MKAIAVKVQRLSFISYTHIFWLLAFCIPLAFSSSQLVTGTLVNALLFLGAARLSKHDLIPLVVLPSLGALSHGVLFGSYTPFLWYVLPFLWLGNYCLVWIWRHISVSQPLIGVVASALVKCAILASTAYCLVYVKILPPPFVISFGIIQLGTALCGGLVALGMMKIISYERR